MGDFFQSIPTDYRFRKRVGEQRFTKGWYLECLRVTVRRVGGHPPAARDRKRPKR